MSDELAYCSPLIEELETIINTSHDIAAMFKRELLALAAGSITGYDYCFDYVLEKYYEVKDIVEENPLQVPRLYREYVFFTEAVEAAIDFEERLADTTTVFLAEPVLAAALKAYCAKNLSSKTSPREVSKTPSKTIIIEGENTKKKIIVPFPLYLLALKSLSLLYPSRSFSISGKAEGALIVPDPASIRDSLFRVHPPLPELGIYAKKYLDAACRKITGIKDPKKACSLGNVLVIGYQLEGFYWRTWYICSGD